MKVKLTALAKELDQTFERMDELKGQKLTPEEYTGVGKNTWLTPEAAEKLRLCFVVPPAVPDVYDAIALRGAANPKWVFCKILGTERNAYVLIPKRHRANILGKKFKVHAISDATGTTYRHADCAKYAF